MEKTDNLIGKLLISQPKNNNRHFSKSIILIAQHGRSGAWGVIVNHSAKTVTMNNIMQAAGIEYDGIETVYMGGPVEPTRVHVIHSLDWSSQSTLKITDKLGITGDLSVLAAISQGHGPEFYRAGIGLAVWSAGQLDGEMSGIDPWKPEQQWLITDATVDLCLTGGGEEQWQRAINQCVSNRVSELF